MAFLGFLALVFWVGYLVSCIVTFRRGQRAIRQRVEARGGRPIDDAEVWARIAWGLLKSFLWPINLAIWLWLDRPEPGSYRRPPSRVADAVPPATPARRPEHESRARGERQVRPTPLVDPTPSGRRAKIGSTVPVAPTSAPAFPAGPVVEPGSGGKAPHPATGSKVGATRAAYIPSHFGPPPPPATPSPVLPIPRAEFGAPQLEQDYTLRLLEGAGFPATPHNVFAVQERLGILFSAKARQFIEGMGTEQDWATFVRRAGYPTGDMHAWPQHVLNAIARWDRDAVPHIQDFPGRYSAILLESGGFLGGSPDVPLATAGEWNLRGIAQPSARLLPAPR